MFLPIVWLFLGGVTVYAAVRSTHNPRAIYMARYSIATLYIAAGAFVNTAFLARGDDYADFANGSYIPFVRDTWRSLVVPNVNVFIPLLIAFELAVGIAVLRGGRWTKLGLTAAIGFHVALLTFGWGFYIWSVPMIAALVLLLNAENHEDHLAHVHVPMHAAAA
jgi:hypothetical protein